MHGVIVLAAWALSGAVPSPYGMVSQGRLVKGVCYIITDVYGRGEERYPYLMSDGETVYDAVTRAGLLMVAIKGTSWVARPMPECAEGEVVLPIDWAGILEHRSNETNYALLPGDRIYVRKDALVTVEGRLARITNPMERLRELVQESLTYLWPSRRKVAAAKEGE